MRSHGLRSLRGVQGERSKGDRNSPEAGFARCPKKIGPKNAGIIREKGARSRGRPTRVLLRHMVSDDAFKPQRLVVHPSCANDWILTRVRSLPDGSIEVRAMPRPIAPLRLALEDETAAHLSRPSRDPEDQLVQHECVFYVEPPGTEDVET